MAKPAVAVVTEYDRPWLTPYQMQALFGPERYAVVEGSTKSGKTTACIVWLIEQALAGRDGQNFWWVSPVYPQAKVVFRRAKRALPQELYRANDTELSLTIGNGAVIWFKGSDNPDALYGDDVHAAVMDEATRCKEEAWIAVRSTLTATEGPVRIIGNVKGRKNWMWRLARLAEQGVANMSYAKVTSIDAVSAGIVSAEEVEDAKAKLPAEVFRELYMAEAADDQGNPFGVAAIRACTFAVPPVAKPVRCYGLDLAKSYDWSVLVGLDADGTVVHFARWQAPWQETIRRVAATVGNVPCLVDSTGAGDPVLESLQREAHGTFAGYVFSSASKQRLMEGLSVAIQSGSVRFPAGQISTELELFEYVYTRTGVRYSAPEGHHDDCVCALALAVQQHAEMGRSGRVLRIGLG